jgi:exodeoxyribonuclease-3
VGLRDTIHCTEEERYHLRAWSPWACTTATACLRSPPKATRWWDYRDFGFRRNRGMRIDHILVSNALKPLVQACVIDKAPRQNERPSDHAPVVVPFKAVRSHVVLIVGLIVKIQSTSQGLELAAWQSIN